MIGVFKKYVTRVIFLGLVFLYPRTGESDFNPQNKSQMCKQWEFITRLMGFLTLVVKLNITIKIAQVSKTRVHINVYCH